ncbi:tRNA (adenosine(37)-N6)-threonylcarbamoyltransferase complex ATPase subunit type 1 TsaE [Alloscardovia criceti]|uniref:tRNA (adenosine(37)-N6)-threonylcarbamoyltransferase complex ATPase subunit type 1 TsaE n=1 Tax=Alloscardovia criceti TaxID=356828 RepID=UPI000366820B|nr:tRNA (adenosine(37)-N6)-threonylcarbamoyltransferase complex ATPase subunit type 1 TsaE [Alloscardovia criceti]
MSGEITIHVPTAEDMHAIGQTIAHTLQGGDVIVLSGPLGAGKTTLSQGIGKGLHIEEAVVSPTFTIARELNGSFDNGQPAHLVHVDAYRLPGSDNDDVMLDSQQQAAQAANRLLDQLESLGLDETLEDPDENTVILIEWGSMMASVLSDSRLEIAIDRSIDHTTSDSNQDDELTSDGMRTLTLTPVGASWEKRIAHLSVA